MLPRGIDLVRVLHLRQRFVGRRLCFNITPPAIKDTSKLSSTRAQLGHGKATCGVRAYSTEKSKMINMKPAETQPMNRTSETPATKTKTTQNTATEITAKVGKHEPIKQTAPESAPNAPATPTATSVCSPAPAPPPAEARHLPSPTATAPVALQHITPVATSSSKPQTKKIEVKTSKGILSITTTIEDSKINEIVFEKSREKSTPPESSIPPAKVRPVDMVKEAGKAAAASAVETKKTESVTAAMMANEKAETVKLGTPLPTIVVVDDAATTKAAAKVIAAAIVTPEAKPKQPRIKVDLNRSSLERNFITPVRAMADFLLTPTDLESLPRIKRRSPYEQEPPITVFWRKDVEARSLEKWGSRENLLRETLTREIENKTHQQNIFTVKRRLRDYRREIGSRAVIYDDEPGLKGKSGKVVLIAIGINSMNFLFKVGGWLYTGSHSMFAEAIHSLADTANQLILAYGIHKSVQSADHEHPYGYSNMKYVSSLISGVGIFCVGTGLSIYHGITGLMHPEPMQDFFWAFFILGGSLVSEGATLLVAVNEVRRSAKIQNMTFKEYVVSGKDPCVNVVLMEDAAAVASVAVAAGCMGLSSITGSPMFDAMGSLLVGGILGGVASFIIYTNVAALVGKSIAEEKLDKINSELESDVMIRAIHDVKGIDMGNSLVRYKAEMDFDGRELTRSYLDKQDLNELLKVVKSFHTVEELEKFLLNHGENIVDLMGGEIDRIEMKLRKKFPEIRHCDLEIL